MSKINESLFLSARSISYLGNKLLNYSLAFFLLNKTGKSLDLAILFSMEIIPEIFFNFIGGIIGDTFNKKYINIIGDIVRIFILIFFILYTNLNSSEYIYHISLLVFSLSFVGIFIAPSIDAIIPEIISKNKLLDFNIKYSLCLDTVDVIAPILAGFIYFYSNIYLIIFLDLFSFILSSFLFYYIKVNPSIYTPSKKNVCTIFSNKKINLVIIEKFLFSTITNPILDIYIIYYFINILRFSDFKYGQYQSVFNFLSILIIILFFKKIKILKKYKLYTLLILGILLLFIKNNFFLNIFSFIIIENTSKIIKINLDTFLQENSSQYNFAKINSLYWTASSLGMILGNFIISFLIDNYFSF